MDYWKIGRPRLEFETFPEAVAALYPDGQPDAPGVVLVPRLTHGARQFVTRLAGPAERLYREALPSVGVEVDRQLAELPKDELVRVLEESGKDGSPMRRHEYRTMLVEAGAYRLPHVLSEFRKVQAARVAVGAAELIGDWRVVEWSWPWGDTQRPEWPDLVDEESFGKRLAVVACFPTLVTEEIAATIRALSEVPAELVKKSKAPPV